MVIGIDLGIKGGIAVLDDDGNILDLREMPLIKDDKKWKKRFYKFVDTNEIYNIINNYKFKANKLGHKLTVVIEDIGNIYGIDKFSMYSLGRQRGIVEGICYSMGVEIVAYPPKVWQGYMFSKINKVVGVNSSMKKTKQYAFEVYKMLYSHMVKDVMKRKNPKDGIVDAVLIGRFHIEMTKN